eukprot:11133759-Karenia_brevis.AAC.1
MAMAMAMAMVMVMVMVPPLQYPGSGLALSLDPAMTWRRSYTWRKCLELIWDTDDDDNGDGDDGD